MTDVPDIACPDCGQHTLTVEYRYEAKPIGTFSLSGAQMKFSATRTPWLVCGNCDFTAQGKQ